ncbi:ABC transporter permease [Diplocloster agilis]|uniref:ABC transporter permease n=1 Tax=Diplocloster agilis TaxID=2850323 RepID=A0A949K492_9FIRM|nr:ABC transporter permease [Diplocloster agilis]MBU9735178.1 ABC transporter permease [Diplocloster agilis]
MRILLWAEFQKLRRSNIIMFTIFATILIAVIVLVSGITGQLAINSAGWYMTITQVWATMFVLPAVIALLGSYMICREEQDDTLKSLQLIPVNEIKLTVAKMTVALLFSILIYLLLFLITFLTEAALHFSALSMAVFSDFLKMYLLEGIGVFFAVSPIIALVPYLKKSYWLALVLAEVYSFSGLFMSMSNALKTFYPITAIFGVSGYYETTIQSRGCSLGILVLCGCISALLLKNLNHRQKE